MPGTTSTALPPVLMTSTTKQMQPNRKGRCILQVMYAIGQCTCDCTLFNAVLNVYLHN